MRTESLAAPSHAPGKRFLDARDRRPQTASEAVLLPCRDCKPALRPRKTAGYSSNHGKSRLAWECVVGPGGLEPATRRWLSARHRRWSQKGLAFCCEPSGSSPVGLLLLSVQLPRTQICKIRAGCETGSQHPCLVFLSIRSTPIPNSRAGVYPIPSVTSSRTLAGLGSSQTSGHPSRTAPGGSRN